MQDRLYECKKGFGIPKWDCENDEQTDEDMTIEEGSIWNCTGNGYMCDGEIRLENDEDSTWIEISKETLKEYFKDITKDNNEMSKDEYLRSGY